MLTKTILLVLCSYSVYAMEPGIEPQEASGFVEFVGQDRLVIAPQADPCGLCRKLMLFEQSVTVASCHHIFHTTCINECVDYGYKDCPACRKSLPEYGGQDVQVPAQDDAQEQPEIGAQPSFKAKVKAGAICVCAALLPMLIPVINPKNTEGWVIYWP